MAGLRAFWSPPALFFSPASGLSTRVCGAFADHRPRRFSAAVHPPEPCTSPSEHLPLRPALPETPLRSCDRLNAPARAPSLRFPSPSSRRQPTVSTWIRGREPPRPLRSVHGVSHALDGLFHHRPCRLVSSRSHVQGSPFRDLSPTAKPTRLSPDLRTLMPLVLRRLRCDPAQRRRPRLQGLVLFAMDAVDLRQRLRNRRLRFPPGFSPPPGFPLHQRDDRKALATPRALVPTDLAIRPAAIRPSPSPR